jgi:hypothetical protein
MAPAPEYCTQSADETPEHAMDSAVPLGIRGCGRKLALPRETLLCGLALALGHRRHGLVEGELWIVWKHQYLQLGRTDCQGVVFLGPTWNVIGSLLFDCRAVISAAFGTGFKGTSTDAQLRLISDIWTGW